MSAIAPESIDLATLPPTLIDIAKQYSLITELRELKEITRQQAETIKQFASVFAKAC